MIKYIEPFIAEHIKSNLRYYQLVKYVLLIDFILLLKYTAYGIVYYFSGFAEGTFAVSISGIVLILHGILFMRFKVPGLGGIILMLNFLVIFSYTVAHTGGIFSPFILSIFALGPTCFFFFRKREALIITVGSVLYVCMICLLDFMDVGFTQRLTRHAQLVCLLLVFISHSLGILGMLLFYKKNKKSSLLNLKATNIKLNHTNEDLERFAYIASHDLKTPLRSIGSFIGLLKKKYRDRFDNQGQEFLEIITNNVNQMDYLIKDILVYSRTKNKSLSIGKVDLNQLVEQIRKETIAIATDQVDITSASLPIIESDETAWRQLLSNLIENGLKYNESSVKKINVLCNKSKETFSIAIEDNGIGIEEKYFDKVFELFGRLHSKDEYAGNGIGLGICRKIIAQMDGSMELKSSPGKGSTFVITLPINMILEKGMAENKELSSVLD